MANPCFTIFGFGKRRSRKQRSRKRKSKRRSHKRRSHKRRSHKRRSRRFGYSHDQGPRLIGAHMEDGMLLADNAFQWMGNPEARAENAG